MRSWAALLALSLVACGSRGDLPRVSCGTSCAIKYTVRVDPAFSPAEVEAVWLGLQAWTRASNGSVCYVPEGTKRGYNIVIIRGDDQKSLRPYIDDWNVRAAIYKEGTIVVAMDVSRTALDAIVAHEAGHALGLDHALNERSVMYYRTTSIPNGQTLLPIDKEAFRTLRCR